MLLSNAIAERRPAAVYVAATAAVVLWSGTPIANKMAIASIDPATAGLLRSAIAGIIAGALAVATRLPFPANPRQKALLWFSGISSFALWPLLLSLGLGRTTANHAALIIAMIPVVTGLVAAAVDRSWPKLSWWMGVALAAAGTFFLVTSRADQAESGGTLAGDALVLSGILACACGYVAGGRLVPVIGTWATTLWGLALAAALLIPAIALLASRTAWSDVALQSWLAIAYMAVPSSLVGYALWFWALGHGGIARIASWQLGQPLLSVLFAAILLGERITPVLLACGASILLGTTLTQIRARPASS
jgi:drug/metabolite transporter (DMT)-like permease